MLMREAEKSILVLMSRADSESKDVIEVIKKLVSEVRILRSRGRRLSRNKKSLCVKLEGLTSES